MNNTEKLDGFRRRPRVTETRLAIIQRWAVLVDACMKELRLFTPSRRDGRRCQR
jgi:hypothetical protein